VHTWGRGLLLEVNNIDVFYSEAEALRDVTVKVNRDEIVAVIGANGAGKTTLMKTIAGVLKPRKGSVKFNGERIDHLSPWDIVRRGIILVPEGRQIFYEMTTLENLMMGAYLSKDKKEIKNSLERVFKIFPRLEERKNQIAGTLSGGEQQMLATGRSLMSNPKLLLLDEPSLGLAPILVEKIYDAIEIIHEQGLMVLLVEQNALKALNISDRAYVLENGRTVLEDKSDRLINNDYVRRAYLGIT